MNDYATALAHCSHSHRNSHIAQASPEDLIRATRLAHRIWVNVQLNDNFDIFQIQYSRNRTRPHLGDSAYFAILMSIFITHRHPRHRSLLSSLDAQRDDAKSKRIENECNALRAPDHVRRFSTCLHRVALHLMAQPRLRRTCVFAHITLELDAANRAAWQECIRGRSQIRAINFMAHQTTATHF